MDVLLDKGFELLKMEPGSGMLNSILLFLIWWNVKSLKAILTQLITDHEVRITKLEVKAGIIQQLKPSEGK